jgi:hypothetical protein
MGNACRTEIASYKIVAGFEMNQHLITLLLSITSTPLFGMLQENTQRFKQAPIYYSTVISRNITQLVTFFSLPTIAAGQSNATTMSLDAYMNNFYIVLGVSAGIFLASSCVGCFIKNSKHCKNPQYNEAEDTEDSLEQVS